MLKNQPIEIKQLSSVALDSRGDDAEGFNRLDSGQNSVFLAVVLKIEDNRQKFLVTTYVTTSELPRDAGSQLIVFKA